MHFHNEIDILKWNSAEAVAHRLGETFCQLSSAGGEETATVMHLA